MPQNISVLTFWGHESAAFHREVLRIITNVCKQFTKSTHPPDPGAEAYGVSITSVSVDGNRCAQIGLGVDVPDRNNSNKVTISDTRK